MTNYYEVDKGRFDAALIRENNNYFDNDVMVAYTDGDEIKTTNFYNCIIDYTAVKEFANYYGLDF